jgi:hypothetical protein
MIPIQSKAANPERDLGLRGLAQAFRLGVRPDMNWSLAIGRKV